MSASRTAKNLLTHINLDEFEAIVYEPSDEDLLDMIEKHPDKAIEMLKESWQISQLEMFLEEGNRKLEKLKRKRTLNQTKALRMLQSYNQVGYKELPKNKKRRLIQVEDKLRT